MIINYQTFEVHVREERKEQDIHVLNEVIGNDCYGLASLGFIPDTVIDIGSHIGAFTMYAKSLFPNAEFICVEPEQDNFNLLKQNCSFARCVPFAIGKEYGMSKVFQAEEQTGSNIVGSIDGHTNITRHGYHYEEKGSTIVVPISEILNMTTGKNILLKLDCEGAEYVIFDNIRSDYAERIKYIVGEYHKTFEELNVKSFPRLTFTDRGNSLFSAKCNISSN